VEHFGNLTTVFGGKDPGDQLVEADATVAVPEEVSKVSKRKGTDWLVYQWKNLEKP
jgi:hypothetical protein